MDNIPEKDYNNNSNSTNAKANSSDNNDTEKWAKVLTGFMDMNRINVYGESYDNEKRAHGHWLFTLKDSGVKQIVKWDHGNIIEIIELGITKSYKLYPLDS